MKITGIDFNAPTNIVIPILRGETEIIFQASCISDYSEFEKICIEPEAPMKRFRESGKTTPDLNDKDYREKIEKFSTYRYEWMVAKSLLATEGLEWDTVDFSNPDTFANYKEELKSLKFSDIQIGQLIQGVLESNGLSESRLSEAKNRFLASQQEAQPS